MIVRTVIMAVMCVYAVFLTARHNMHMFQLNGYKNDEHINWIKKHLRQQWLLYFGLVTGIARLFLHFLALDILMYLTLIMIILVYRALHRLNSKKKLVYTARVKRMFATDIIVSLTVLALCFIFGGIAPISGLLMIVVSSQWFAVICMNIINHPFESALSRHYINDAKRILAQASDHLTVIGVTGSFGKTSMKFFLQTLLADRFNVLVTPGNFNTPLGVTITVRNHLKPSHEIFICEMGARRVGEIREICEIAKPSMGIITSIGPQHLETFFTMENIQRTKFELADAVMGKGPVFLNGDNEYINERAADYPDRIMFSTTEGEGGYSASDITVSNMGTDFTVTAPSGEKEHFQMRLIGAHNVINVTGAIAVANTLGISLKDLRIPVRRLTPVEHRMKLIERGNATIIDDAYNSNPVGSKAAVETLALFDGVRILITPGMVELGDSEDEYNEKFGTYAADCCDYILLVGKKHTEPIYRGAVSKGFPESKLKVYELLEDAMAYAYSIKDEGHKYILLENDLPDNYK